jgi:TP901 family phage tail tape measure protein
VEKKAAANLGNLGVTSKTSGQALATAGKGVTAISSALGMSAAPIEKMNANLARLGVTAAGVGAALATAGKGATSIMASLGGASTTTANLSRLGISAGGDANSTAGKGQTAVMGALTGTTKEATKATKDFSVTNKNLQGVIRGTAGALGGLWLSYGNIIPMMAAFAAVSGVKNIYDLGVAFEYATTYADSLGDSLSGLKLPDLQNSLLNFEGLRQGPVDLAEGMKEFAKAGVDVGVALEQIEEMSRFATVAEMGLGDATKLVIGQSKAFGVTFSDAANMIGAAALSSATDISELGSAMSFTTELASVAKVTLDEVATGMAVMANRGIRGSKAATAMRTSILKMTTPSAELKNRLDALGISWGAFTDQGKIKDLKTLFAELQRVTKNLTEEQRLSVLTELFDRRSMKGGIALLEATGEEWNSMNEKIRTAAEGVTFIQNKYSELEKTAKAAMERLGVATEKALIGAFDGAAVAGMMDSLAQSMASDSVSSTLKTIASGVNEVGAALAAAISVVTSSGVDLAEAGVIGYIVLGSYGPARIIAGIGLVVKELNALREVTMDPISGALLSELFGEDYKPELAKQVGMMENLSGAIYHAKLAVGGLVDIWSDYFSEMAKHHDEQFEFSGGQQSFGGSAEEGEKTFAQWQMHAKQVKETVDQITFDNASKSTSKWETALANVQVELDKILAKKKEAGIRVTPEDEEKFKAALTAGVTDTFATKVQKDIDALTTANIVKEFERAGQATKVFEARVAEVRKTAEAYAKDNGQWNADTGTFDTKGKEYYDALLESKGLFIDKTKQEVEATRALGLELKKAFEGEFGQETMKGGASDFLSDFQEGIHKALPLIDEWDEKLSSIDDKVVAFANKKLEAGVEFNIKDLEVYAEKLIWLEEYKGLQQIAKDSKVLDFKIMINGMREAKEGMNQFEVSANGVKASYAELKQSAYEYLRAKGQVEKDADGNWKFNSKAGAEYFQKLTTEANIFGKAIKAAEKEISNMEDSLSDSTFSMNQAIAKVASTKNPNLDSAKFDYQQAIAASEHYAAEAKRALDGTLEGRKRAIEMYEKAFSTEQGLTPETTSGINAQVQAMKYLRDQIVALKQEDIISAEDAVKDLGTEQQAAKDYIASIVEGYGTIETAVESHGKLLTADGQKMVEWKNGQITAIDAVITKQKELNALSFTTSGGLEMAFPKGTSAEAVQAAKDYNTTLNGSKEATIDLNKLTEETAKTGKKAWDGVKTEVEKSTAAVAEGGTGIVTFKGKTLVWANDSVKAVGSVDDAYKALAKTINSMPTAKVPTPTSIDGERALGGPVSAGGTFLVGEKGPELFAPRSSGVIIPNNKLSGSSERMVDINLSIGGGAAVPLKGPQTSIDQLQKQMKTKMRYAG